MKNSKSNKTKSVSLPKAPTGIQGLDEITFGGFPKGRSSLICGSAGCGKTLLGLEFLVNGARQFNEPGVFLAFEESPQELIANVSSLKFDLDRLAEDGLVTLDHVRIERAEIEESGEYDLEGLFIRLEHAIDKIGAKRVVLDTLEGLFAGFSNEGIIRAELRRLFQFLKDKGVTSVITAERGDVTLTRQGLEEYVADCVILLDNRINDQVSTRRLRIIKYRGSSHGANEYPFLIDEGGFSVLPITSLGLQHQVSNEAVPTGVPDLDAMLGVGGYYRGSSILVSGTAGTGKSTLASSLVISANQRGERALYFSFEESPGQIVRNMRSVGIDLQPGINKGLLKINANRPAFFGLEMHLVSIHKLINEFKPAVVVIDPITSLVSASNYDDVRAMLTRLIDFLKFEKITGLFTSLSNVDANFEKTDIEVSSLMDTWLLLSDIELNGERNRGLYVLKSRGMAHSNQIREFILSRNGIKLIDVYVGTGGVLTGSSRLAQEARDQEDVVARRQEVEMRSASLERKRKSLEAQIGVLRAEFQAEAAEIGRLVSQQEQRDQRLAEERSQMASSRKNNSRLGTGRG
ncbi:MAG: circadian clock protein KaiC [Candidatus Binatus sp.]|uniref:circadian clock protein KaiC n=1 Tax=Candidatus Binatus sp. TaxID=2811406 RepID=UPI0027268468|nr:circadian clock protein KaiC [Candidatus Binatus sp.]MDO8432044.1 circadian clock protein KaiC [Candidatus Binatus sp.]